jgi:hypothetical protein
MHGTVDGKKVAFTGDNIFGDPANPLHSGHEALVARNSAIPEEGYIFAAEYLSQLKPDLIIGGHSFVMDDPAKMIGRYRDWAYLMREAFQEISYETDYRYWFDPYWVHAEPYRLKITNGRPADLTVSIRNFQDRDQRHRIEIHTPPGIIAEPEVLEGIIKAGSRERLPIRISTVAQFPLGVHNLAFDVTLDGKPYGEWFDALLIVE